MKIIILLIMVFLSSSNLLAGGETFQDILNNARKSYYDKGNYEGCIKIIKKGIKEYPKDNEIVAGKSLLVSSYIKSGRYQEAKVLLDILVREYPDYKERPLWEYQKAYIDYKEGNWLAAIDGFIKYVNDYPKGDQIPYALYYISSGYKKLKNYKLSIEFGNRFLTDNPDHHFAENAELIIAHSLLREKQYNEAEKKYNEFISKHKGSENLDRAYFFLGSCFENRSYHSKSSLQEALNYFDIVINNYPDSDYKSLAEERVGMIYYKLDQYEQAIIYLTKFINDKQSKKRRNFKGALYFLGQSYQKIGDTKEAKKLYTRIIKDFPNTKWEKHAQKSLKKI